MGVTVTKMLKGRYARSGSGNVYLQFDLSDVDTASEALPEGTAC